MIEFKHKAHTLKQLEQFVKTSIILPQYCFSVNTWLESTEGVLSSVKDFLSTYSLLIARSSACDEDTSYTSQAGKYKSIQNIKTLDEAKKAIEEIISSYKGSTLDNYVFFQPMLTNVACFGVAFTMDPNTGGNYYVINHDESGDTANLTGGQADVNYKTYYCFKRMSKTSDPMLKRIINLLSELESITGNESLDVEFAYDKMDKLYLLQARPLLIPFQKANWNEQNNTLKNIYNKIHYECQPKPYLYGDKTMFGIMPDWNPAEIIGVRPEPLALSLYKALICDEIWAYQRDNYGYKNLRSFPLLISFAGLPYIDIRVSFNSFLPKTLNDELSNKLANHYLSMLEQNPELHDKVEFDIVLSCYTFDMEKKLNALQQHGFSTDEINQIKVSLHELTSNILSNKEDIISTDINKITELKRRQNIINESSLDKISKIYWLIEDCKRYGTLPFAGLARSGFIAISILLSLVEIGILTHDDYQNYLSSIQSINTDLLIDLANLPQSGFLEIYGHLRPGTYNITSERYDENPEKYFDFTYKPQKPEKCRPTFSLTLLQLNQIEQLLKDNNFACSSIELFKFMQTSIEGRENAKFVFSKSISDMLKLLKEIAQENDISIEDASYADISIIKKCYSSEYDFVEEFRRSIEEGKKRFDITRQICLPPLINNADQIFLFDQPDSIPNFVTPKTVTGKVATLEDKDISNKILFIPNADPGYDWIFSKNILGLVTMYGGVNSHMAISAGELQIPAVIGVGDKLYNKYSKAEKITIDCLKRQMEII